MRILLLIIVLQLTGCKWFTDAGTPYFFGTNFEVPEGTPTFQQGFKDGCSTVLYARGNVFYRTRYGYRYDPKMIGNPEYRFGHSRGYTWCFQHMLQGTTGASKSPDRYIMPYGASAFDMSAGNVNDAWGGFWGGLSSPVGSSSVGLDSSLSILQQGIAGGTAGAGGTVFGGNPLWAGGSSGQFFGQ